MNNLTLTLVELFIGSLLPQVKSNIAAANRTTTCKNGIRAKHAHRINKMRDESLLLVGPKGYVTPFTP